ncbi:MAG: hypothetical protein QW153_01495 [Candidatus Bilamarchaeaceae archaeon]
MQSVVVLADERPNLLTELSYILGKEGVRVENMSIEAAGGKTAISILVRDANNAKEVLAKNGFEIVEKNTMVLRVPDYLRKMESIKNVLAEKKILIKNMRLIASNGEKGIIALWVDKPRKAFRLLHEFII